MCIALLAVLLSPLNQSYVAIHVSVGSVWGQKVLAENRSNAIAVEQILTANGIDEPKIVVAMLANAWHESRFNASLVHVDSNDALSVGLFQLNSKGMGWGMSVADRQDIDKAMSRMLDQRYFRDWVLWCRNRYTDLTAGDMAYSFAAKVERCTRASWSPRLHTANAWYSQLPKSFSKFST